MSIFMVFRIALKALARNKLRTALTMLGMIIGVAAVIVMVAIGTGARMSIEQQVRNAGSNIVDLYIAGGATRATAGGVSVRAVAVVRGAEGRADGEEHGQADDGGADSGQRHAEATMSEEAVGEHG